MIELRKIQENRPLQVPFERTIFPDGTSQVWKIKQSQVELREGSYEVLWLFENEAELFAVLQLGELLGSLGAKKASLQIPFLPYSRQDKKISNQSTWALSLFLKLIQTVHFSEVTTFDPHSSVPLKILGPEQFHAAHLKHDCICFPDKGARERYPHLYQQKFIYFEKIRNQTTGVIEGMTLSGDPDLVRGKSVVIVDDICDGGGTFIEIAKKLAQYKPGSIDLCVSHGIFSKGKEVLHQAGIRNIWTTNSLIQNKDQFAVYKPGEKR